jgi:glutathione synthase/RimK-type ligase-like ATP-grasp enzyme
VPPSGTAGSGPPPVRVLLVATDFVTPYRVLRCARASGAEVCVLGNAGAAALRLSRYCSWMKVSSTIIHGERNAELALEINHLARDFAIDMIVPADAPAIRSVLASRDLIEAPCFPLPSLASFDLLNNKWSFAQMCVELGIRHPATRLLPDVAALRQELDSGATKGPVIAKPVGRCAGAGVVVIDGEDTERRLQSINYRPVLVQDYISGEDIGAGAYAREGRIEAFVTHRLAGGVYSVFRDDSSYQSVASIAARLGLDGVYNFDMLRTADQSVYFLECNPRFFHKINLSMLAGINFVGEGLKQQRRINGAATVLSGVDVKFPRTMLRSVLTSGCSPRDLALARYLVSDPLPWLIDRLHLTV